MENENLEKTIENLEYMKGKIGKIFSRVKKPLAYIAAVTAGVLGGRALGLELNDLLGIADNISAYLGRNVAEAMAYRGLIGFYTVATTMAAITTALVAGVKKYFNRQENKDVLQALVDSDYKVNVDSSHLENILDRLQKGGYVTQDKQITEKGLKYLGNPVGNSDRQIA